MSPQRDPLTGQSVDLVRRMADVRAGAEAMARVVWANTDEPTDVASDALLAFAHTLLDLRRLVPDVLFDEYRPDQVDQPRATPVLIHAVPDVDDRSPTK